METSSRNRALSALSFASLALILTILVAAPASADSVGTAKYEYKVTKFVYDASGRLDAAKFGGATCTPEDAMWGGNVTTSDDAELAELVHGAGQVEIHEHGTEGVIEAQTTVSSTFSAIHREVTGCDADGGITNTTTTPCSDKEESELSVRVDIKGAVGTKVKVSWAFGSIGNGDLVPDTFSCVKPFIFPRGAGDTCTKISRTSNLTMLASPRLKLPFKCLSASSVPPRGSGYNPFGTTVTATGALYLTRVHQSR